MKNKSIPLFYLIILFLLVSCRSYVRYGGTSFKYDKYNIFFDVGANSSESNLTSEFTFRIVDSCFRKKESLPLIDTFLIVIKDLKTGKEIKSKNVKFSKVIDFIDVKTVQDVNYKIKITNLKKNNLYNINSNYLAKYEDLKEISCRLKFKTNNIDIDTLMILKRKVTWFFTIH